MKDMMVYRNENEKKASVIPKYQTLAREVKRSLDTEVKRRHARDVMRRLAGERERESC